MLNVSTAIFAFTQPGGRMKMVAFLLLFSLAPLMGAAEEIKEVVWGTDVWPGLTDRDGTGLYTNVFTEAFKSQGVKLTPKYLPFEQSIHLVDSHELDFAGGILKDTVRSEKHVQAQFPILSTPVDAFFRKTSIKGPWQGVNTIKGGSIVASPLLGEAIGLTKGEFLEVSTKAQAFKMVAMGRADFYIDDEKEMALTIKQNKQEIEGYDESDFAIKQVGKTDWFMIAPNNDRGKRIMEIYEKGTLQLFRSGELQTLYDSRGFHVPVQVIELSSK